MDIQLLPNSVEAEEALLGNLLMDCNAYESLAGFLSTNDFFIIRNGWIFQAIADLSAMNRAIDLITVSDLLQKRGQLTELGGAARLTELTLNVPMGMNFEDYATIIKAAATKRRVIEASQKIARMAFEGEQGGIDTLNKAQQIIFDLNEGVRNNLVTMGAAMNDYLDSYDFYEANPDARKGLDLGIDEIDQLLRGLHGGDSVILGGRPGAGKTAMATDIALRVAKRGESVGFISLEMSYGGLFQRLLGNEAEINTIALRDYSLTKDEFSRLREYHQAVTDLPIFIDDSPSQTLTQIKMTARRMVREHGLKLLIIDYLQLIESDDKGMRHEQIAKISRGLKIMARELSIPILTLSQISRAVDIRALKEPMLADLSEGSGIEKDADIVIFLWLADEESAPCVTSMKVAKNRAGATGRKELYFEKEYARFRKLAMTPLDY